MSCDKSVIYDFIMQYSLHYTKFCKDKKFSFDELFYSNSGRGLFLMYKLNNVANPINIPKCNKYDYINILSRHRFSSSYSSNSS